MRTTSLEEFRRELRATGSYSTPDDRRAAKRAPRSALTTFRYCWAAGRVFPLSAIYEPLGKLTTASWAEMCFSTITVAERLGMQVLLEGWKNRMECVGPVMYVCNHMSTLETTLLPPVLLTFGPFNVVAKASLTHLPFLEKAASRMGLVAIGRKSPREDLLNMLSVGTERIRSGNSFLIFPQGTRQEVFSRRRFSSIGAKLAEKAGCPIVPLAIDSRCLPTRKRGLLSRVFKDFGTVDTTRDIRLACGPVIPCGNSREMQDASFDWIAGKLEEWGLEVER